jgi:hypothetical protein
LQVCSNKLINKDEEQFNILLESIELLSCCNIKSNKSYTNKSKFKLMDILELID